MSTTHTQSITLLYGFPGAGKSTYAHPPADSGADAGTVVLSRDVIGGTIKDLVPRVGKLLEKGKSVVLDNTHLTAESRAPFVALAEAKGIPIHVIHIDTPLETCMIHVLRRMWATHGQVFHCGKKGDPQAYAPVALFAARKKAEPPMMTEGFTSIHHKPGPAPAWDPALYPHKALFLDIDGTLRASEHLPYKFPTKPEEVAPLHNKAKMRAVLEHYRDEGWLLVGVSNQSGVAKGTLSVAEADTCFSATRELFGLSASDFPILYCPHRAAPPSCYCRKPQSGLLVEACERYKINPRASLMVGDMKTDETAATRMGVPFLYADKFWAKKLAA
jgi:D-glycero-D-manno-heptose 1,7-bisphosphate phosphatase